MSSEEIERRKLSVLSAKAELYFAQAKLDEANLNLEYIRVKASISGRISKKFVDTGNLISGGNSDATLLTRVVALEPIVEILDRYYLTQLFEEASGSWKHSLEGIHVTDIVESYININDLDSFKKHLITQKIDASPKVKKYFHKEILFPLHLH